MAHQKTMYLLPVLCHTFTTILVLQNTYVCYLSFGRSGAQAGLKSHKGCIQSVVQGNCLNGGSTKKESASSFTQVVGRIYNLVAVRQRASVSHCQPEVVQFFAPQMLGLPDMASCFLHAEKEEKVSARLQLHSYLT